MRRYGILPYETHGCAHGLKAPNGLPIFKPWIIATDDSTLGVALERKQCGGRHETH